MHLEVYGTIITYMVPLFAVNLHLDIALVALVPSLCVITDLCTMHFEVAQLITYTVADAEF